ncbi:MAG: hypothetical protein ACLSVG_02850 [Clostridia bacterium]
MEYTKELIDLFAEEFDIPIIREGTRVWFFRTQSGLYYFDFHLNHYIALGWDLISQRLIDDANLTKEAKREHISALYPEQQRPGLILGQMDTFYNKMQPNDLVVIPSSGGKTVAIGILGEISTSVSHEQSDDEYIKCIYKHKRDVSWLKEVDLYTDVYLARILRAQQTISDISEYAEMVYRNLHPCYLSSNAMHLTLQKTSVSAYRIYDNVMLQSSILQINNLLCTYLGMKEESEKIKIKTAVGSPGFLEIVFPDLLVSTIVVAIIKLAIGKAKNKNGGAENGILGIVSKMNELINDHCNRQKTKAEIGQIEANTKKILAESAQIDAATKKLEAETAKIQAEIRSAQTTSEREKALVENLNQYCDDFMNAAQSSGIQIRDHME